MANSNGRARLLLNERGQDASWIGLRLLRADGTEGVGARVDLTAGERRLVRRSRVAGSYASSNDPRVLFGLGEHRAPVEAVVRWPGGRRELFRALAAGRYHELREGAGEVLP